MTTDRLLYGNTIAAWITAAGTLALLSLAMWLVHRFALSRLAGFAGRTHTVIDDVIVHALGRTKLLLAFLVAVFFASLVLTFDPQIELALRRAAVIAVILQVGLWATAAVAYWVDRFAETTADEDPAAVTTVSALSFIGRLVIWLLALLLILDNFGVEVTALLTGLGIGGIAVALAVQNILGDLFASLSIVLDKPFVLGDFLVVGDHMGTVEHIGLKTTRLRALSGEQLVFGNDDLLRSRIRNMGRMAERRCVFSIGVTYDTPRDTLAAIPGWVAEIVEQREHARLDRSHLKGFGAYSIDFEVVYYMEVPAYNTYMDTQQSIHLAIHEKFEREGVEFAYPTQVVYTIPRSGDAEDAAPRD